MPTVIMVGTHLCTFSLFMFRCSSWPDAAYHYPHTAVALCVPNNQLADTGRVFAEALNLFVRVNAVWGGTYVRSVLGVISAQNVTPC